MANTNILIKRSGTTRSPVSLGAGEFAYSYASDTLFLGNATGNGVINVGGLLYTQTIDNATSANTGSTLVKRDADGKFAGRLTGIADKSDQLTNARNFSISGHDITAAAVSFDGTGAVTLDASLNEVPGLSAGTYGSTTQIPSVTVAANGRVIAISTSSVATDLEIVGDSGNTTIDLLTETLRLTGGDGITSTVSSNEVTFDVDTTVVRANTPITLQTIDGALAINGNLTVLGTQVTVNTETLNIADPLLYLASNNYSSDIVDIGYVGNYYDGSSQRHAGVFRNAGNKEFYIFDNYDKEPESNDIDVGDSSFRLATVNANLKSTLANIDSAVITNGDITTANVGAMTVTGDTYHNGKVLANPSNGYGFNGYPDNYINSSGGNLRFNQGGSQKFMIDSAAITSFTKHEFIAGSNTAPAILSSAYASSGGIYFPASNTVGIKGVAKVSDTTGSTSTTSGALQVSGGVGIAENTYIGGDLNVLTGNTTLNRLTLSNELTVPFGGTGRTTFTQGNIVIGNGTDGLLTLANTSFTVTGSGAANNTLTSLTIDAYGRATAATYTPISGLTVPQGGTGASSFTTNGITYGNGSGAIQVTAAAGTADQTWSNQVLTTTNAGVPVWTTALDGGTF
jgi:hypothetical protein